MNVFDEEAREMCSQEEAQRLIVLMQAGLGLDELEAWAVLTSSDTVS